MKFSAKQYLNAVVLLSLLASVVARSSFRTVPRALNSTGLRLRDSDKYLGARVITPPKISGPGKGSGRRPPSSSPEGQPPGKKPKPGEPSGGAAKGEEPSGGAVPPTNPQVPTVPKTPEQRGTKVINDLAGVKGQANPRENSHDFDSRIKKYTYGDTSWASKDAGFDKDTLDYNQFMFLKDNGIDLHIESGARQVEIFGTANPNRHPDLLPVFKMWMNPSDGVAFQTRAYRSNNAYFNSLYPDIPNVGDRIEISELTFQSWKEAAGDQPLKKIAVGPIENEETIKILDSVLSTSKSSEGTIGPSSPYWKELSGSSAGSPVPKEIW